MLILKFSDTKEHLEQLLKGKLHLTCYKKFRISENEKLKEGQGDDLEGVAVINKANLQSVNVTFNNNRIQEHEVLELWDDSYNPYPVFCCTRISPDMIESKINHENKTFDLGLDLERMRHTFGKYVVVIRNVAEFERRLQRACKGEKTNYMMGFIDYTKKQNNIGEYLKMIAESDGNVMFCKDEDFSYQNEWRFIIARQEQEYYTLNIGDISDIATLTTVDNFPMFRLCKVQGK